MSVTLLRSPTLAAYFFAATVLVVLPAIVVAVVCVWLSFYPWVPAALGVLGWLAPLRAFIGTFVFVGRSTVRVYERGRTVLHFHRAEVVTVEPDHQFAPEKFPSFFTSAEDGPMRVVVVRLQGGDEHTLWPLAVHNRDVDPMSSDRDAERVLFRARQALGLPPTATEEPPTPGARRPHTVGDGVAHTNVFGKPKRPMGVSALERRSPVTVLRSPARGADLFVAFLFVLLPAAAVTALCAWLSFYPTVPALIGGIGLLLALRTFLGTCVVVGRSTVRVRDRGRVIFRFPRSDVVGVETDHRVAPERFRASLAGGTDAPVPVVVIRLSSGEEHALWPLGVQNQEIDWMSSERNAELMLARTREAFGIESPAVVQPPA